MAKTKLKHIVAFLFILLSFEIHCQYFPKDGSKLNYNQIYFEFPSQNDAASFTLHLTLDSTDNKQDFTTYPFQTKSSKYSKIYIEGLKFGKKYKWYIETILKNKTTIKSEIKYFSLYDCPYADTSKYKFQQHYFNTNNSDDGIIWLDHAHCAINKKLEVVWFLAPINEDFKENKQIRDFRVYKDGSISFISEGDAYHVTKDLEIIWKAPSNENITGEKKANYHHSFEKLNNGNYLILGNQFVELEKTDTKDTLERKIEFSCLIEYNSKKEVVWYWKLIDHFPLDLLANPETNYIYNTHCNSVSISQDGNKILLGFRDLSRIIEIDKKTGNILKSIGKKLNPIDTLVFETDLFRFPHDVKYIDKDIISVVNNNDIKNKKISSLVFFKLPSDKQKKIQPLWEFKFDFDKYSNGKSSKLGNYVVLPNKNLLINQGSINRIVEINPKTKTPLWDLKILKNYGNSGWSDFAVYRVFYTKKL